jgi:hypothetical protein
MKACNPHDLRHPRPGRSHDPGRQDCSAPGRHS